MKYRLAVDNTFSNNVKAIEKGTLMYNSHRVEACSINVSTDELFFSGMVAAAMKKKVAYNYKLRISLSGDVINSDCECPARKGPHGTCKHVAAVLIMLSEFGANGEAKIAKSCTENLQSFHRPKAAYSRSPEKAQNIHAPAIDRTNPAKSKYKMTGYKDFVRNLGHNYCKKSGLDLALRYIYGRANIQQAAQDHDYLVLPFTEYWVDTALQRSDPKEIERETRNQSQCVRWFEEREWRLTASRFGELCKLTKRRNIQKLCESLLYPVKFYSKATTHGILHESIAIKQFEVKFNTNVKKIGLCVCQEKPFLAASPDGIIDQKYLVEVKCPYNGRDSMIVPGKNFSFLEYRRGQLSLKKTHSYYMQIQGQLYVCKKRYCFLIVYTKEDLKVLKIKKDDDFCTLSLIPKLELFYTHFFRKYIALQL